MRSSETISKLAEALASALAELKNPALDSTNPHFRNKYVSLAGVRNAVAPVLGSRGVCVLQSLSTNEGGVCCVTRLMHSSGEWIESDGFTVPVSKGDAQGAAGASTYARRYDLLATCGVVGDDDDDGEAASRTPPRREQEPPKADDAGAAMAALVEQAHRAPSPAELTYIKDSWTTKFGPIMKGSPISEALRKRYAEMVDKALDTPHPEEAKREPPQVNHRGETLMAWGSMNDEGRKASGDITQTQRDEIMALGKFPTTVEACAFVSDTFPKGLRGMRVPRDKIVALSELSGVLAQAVIEKLKQGTKP